MSRRDRQRLDDVQAALAAIDEHLTRGGLSDGLVYDAVRVRLIEIGEAVKSLSADLLATEPDLPWTQIGAGRSRRLDVRVDDDTLEALQKPARSQDRPVSDVVRDALNQLTRQLRIAL